MEETARERKNRLQRERRAARTPEERAHERRKAAERRIARTAVEHGQDRDAACDRMRTAREAQTGAEDEQQREAARNGMHNLRAARAGDTRQPKVPIARRPFDGRNGNLRHLLGSMTIKCRSCHALLFVEERAFRSTVANPQFSMCYGKGKVNLPALAEPPEPLRRLLMSRDCDAEEFRDNIRKYNNALTFTSVGAQVDRRYARGGEGHYTYRIQGELFHQMGTLLPTGDEAPNFAQLYICDPERELDERQVFMKRDCMRMLLIISSFSAYCLFKFFFHFYFTILFFFFCRLRRFEKLDARTLQSLQNMLHRHNPYAQLFLHARQRVQEDTAEFSIRLLASRVHDPQRYNAPTAEEIGALIVGGGDLSIANGRDIVLQTIHGTFQRISTLHVSYSPLHFVLLFPDGQDGWHLDIPLQGFERNGEAFIAEDVDAVTGRNGPMRVT